MMVIERCPDAASLEALAIGRMEPEEVERLALHCEECEHCIQALQQLHAEDALVETMRSGAIGETISIPDHLQGLIHRLKSLCAASAASVRTEAPLGGHDPSLSRSETQCPEEDYDFLAPPQAPDELGRLGAYRVLRILGAGGMGVVFLAEEPDLKRQVTLKVMKPALATSVSARRRFLREAQAMAAVQHDHIIHINQIDQAGDIPFLAMPYLKGETLDDRLEREGSLALQEVVRIGREIAEGLSAAHERGLVHRDIKPPNIWLEGQRSRVKILDFGLVRAVADDVNLTQIDAIVGTPAYMAPEQAHGGEIDYRADLFGLGCVLYRMVTGETPFQGQSPLQILRSTERDQPKPPEELRSDVPSELSSLILQLLAKKPEDRPSSAEEVINALREIETTPKQRTISTLPNTEACDTPSTSRWGGRFGLFIVVLALVMSPLACFFDATVIHFVTDKGELVIETDAQDIEVTIRGDHAVVRDKVNGRSFVLTAGNYEVEVREEGDGGIRFATKKFAITRGGKETFRASPVLPPKEDAPLPYKEDATPEELDRILAKHLFPLGIRSIEVAVGNENPILIRTLSELPQEPFRVRYFDSWGVAALNDRTVEPVLQWIERRDIDHLRFHGNPISDETVRKLVKCPSIKKLYIGATEITPACLSEIATRTDLTELGIYERPFTDGDIEKIRGLTSLEKLSAQRTNLTDAGLIHLRDMKRLHVLDLSGCDVTGAGLEHLRGLPMDLLIVSETQVSGTNDLAKVVHAFPHMRELHLAGLHLADQDLEPLAECESLASLILLRNHLTDGGLKYLARIKSLKKVSLALGTEETNRFTPEAVNELRRALPSCVVEF